ncbi:uncharacterized protein At4g14100-like [Oryza brachyantha]|nr:uncharacterized protein At4g14100-like [Oryza brachyantha]
MAPALLCRPPIPLLLLLLPLLAATTTSATHPTPARWPDRFHATLFANLTNASMASTGPPLRIMELYYDWPRRRNLNVVRHQLSADPLYDVEWDNGTTFYFDSRSCRAEQFPVGVLRPDWLADGEGVVYLGRQVTGGIECDVWDKLGFVVYFQEVATGRPVRWNFLDVTGIQQFVMSFEIGVEMPEDSEWQAPAHCFPADDDDEETIKSESDRIDGVQDGLDAARLLRKLAGAAPFY